MVKQDEIDFWAAMRQTHAYPPRCRPRADEVAEFLNIHPMRAHRMLEKWSSRGHWDCGVSLRTGWFREGAPLALTPWPVREEP